MQLSGTWTVDDICSKQRMIASLEGERYKLLTLNSYTFYKMKMMMIMRYKSIYKINLQINSKNK